MRTHLMQVNDHDDVGRSVQPNHGERDTPFQLSDKLNDKINELVNWRIDPSWIVLPKNTRQFHGGHATVSRGVLHRDSGKVTDTNERNDVDESENARDRRDSQSGAPRGKAVAVKMLKIDNTNDRERVLKLALREAALLTGLDHENIVTLEGFVEDLSKDGVWLIFPWEENGNLKDFAASQDWEIPERIWLINDVTKGVEYLHNLNPPICHGDLKSVNILVTSEYHAIITDFGSARRLTSGDPDARMTSTQPDNMAKPELEFKATFSADTNTMTLTGNQFTLRWAAPELLTDEDPTLCSDIWALGWIFYEVMTNSIPFQDVRKESRIIKQVIEGDLPTVTNDVRISLILRLSSLMIKCWNIDPLERPTAKDCQKIMGWMPMVAPDPKRALETGVSGGRSPRLLIKLGLIHHQQDDYTSASRLFGEALDIYTQIGDSAGRAEALRWLADVHWLRNEYSEALTLYSEVLEIRTKMGDRKGRSVALQGLAATYQYQEEYSKAITFFSEAAEISTELGDIYGRAYALNGLAAVHGKQGEYSKAITLYHEAVQLNTDLGHRDGRAHVLWGLAEMHQKLKEYNEAATLLSEAMQIYADTGNSLGRADALSSLAEVRRDQGHHVDAIDLFDQAAKIYKQIGNAGLEDFASKAAESVRRKIEAGEAE